MINRWREQLSEASRLKFYDSIKDDYKFEPYLTYSVRKVRCAFTRFLISAYNLRVERDRWKTKPRVVPHAEKLCTRCTSHQVDDEVHVFS